MTDYKQEEKPKYRMMGINNHVTDKEHWSYLLFYDIDNHDIDLNKLYEILDLFEISYLVYKTKNGYHVIGLTPITSASRWGYMFDILQKQFPEYYNGQTIRIWRKKDETQELLHWNISYPVISNLLQKFEKRFNENIKTILGLGSITFTKEKWYLIHEFYWTLKG